MGYSTSTLEAALRRGKTQAAWKLRAVARHAATSHQLLLALAFLYWWGAQGLLGKAVLALAALDLMESWFTAEERMELNKDWKVRSD